MNVDFNFTKGENQSKLNFTVYDTAIASNWNDVIISKIIKIEMTHQTEVIRVLYLVIETRISPTVHKVTKE